MKLTAKDEFAGKRIKCPGCNNVVRLGDEPAAGETAAPEKITTESKSAPGFMGMLLCKMGTHNYVKCRCERCLATRDADHDWNGCKCSICGKTRQDGEHQWQGCKCTICGNKRDSDHVWVGGKCSVCGKTEVLEVTCACGRALRGSTGATVTCPACGKKSVFREKYRTEPISPAKQQVAWTAPPGFTEQDAKQRSRTSLGGEDEELAQQLVHLMGYIYEGRNKRWDEAIGTDEWNETREIGERLDANGGFLRMLLVYHRMRFLRGGDDGCLERAWHQIGSWRA